MYPITLIDRQHRLDLWIYPRLRGAGLIPGIGSANKRRRYNVTSALIDWSCIQDDLWRCSTSTMWWSVTNGGSILHYSSAIMGAMASQITSRTNVYSTVYSGADPRRHQSSASLAFVRGIHRGSVNSSHKGPVTRKCFHLMTSSCNFHVDL